ncbi:hypothetical protein L7F22_037801 [Adiantum nelumboides]|nr:hypothetical protein [Adiantum nelumboides]
MVLNYDLWRRNSLTSHAQKQSGGGEGSLVSIGGRARKSNIKWKWAQAAPCNFIIAGRHYTISPAAPTPRSIITSASMTGGSGKNRCGERGSEELAGLEEQQPAMDFQGLINSMNTRSERRAPATSKRHPALEAVLQVMKEVVELGKQEVYVSYRFVSYDFDSHSAARHTADAGDTSQVAKDFVDIEREYKEEFLALDLETSNQKFLEAPYAFGLCLKRVAEEEPVLKDEDFEARLVELEIDKFGRNIVEPNKISSDMGAKINLEHEGQIEADELQKIELLDEDNFLGRAGGSRATSKYIGHALIHYLPKLDKDVFCAFHSQFSDHPELPMFAIKTLSRFMGFLPLPNNVNRILLLVKRTAAFRIFGYALGFHGSRAGYFLCYSSYVLSNKDTNVKLLAGYKRRKFLRYRGKLLETSATKKLKD